jgi:hypothetical protein
VDLGGNTQNQLNLKNVIKENKMEARTLVEQLCDLVGDGGEFNQNGRELALLDADVIDAKIEELENDIEDVEGVIYMADEWLSDICEDYIEDIDEASRFAKEVYKRLMFELTKEQ